MNIYDFFPKKEAPLCAQQIDEFHGVLKGVSLSHNVPLTLSTLIKLLPFVQNQTKIHVTTPDFLGFDPQALLFLQQWNLDFSQDKTQSCGGDIFLDCAANFLGLGNPKAIVELTQTGVHLYQQRPSQIPLLSIDDSLVKKVEDYFGTGDGFVRAFKQITGTPLKDKHFVIWGYGKVGKGISRSLLLEGANCSVIDLNSEELNKAEKKGILPIPATELLSHLKLILSADCLVTATGVNALVSQSGIAQDLLNSQLLLANMGAVDEFGSFFPKSRVLHQKLPINFCLKEPTLMKFLDPVFYAHNLGAKLFMEGKLRAGVSPLPLEEDLRIIKAWQNYWQIDVSEIIDLEGPSN
ncbi:MAG: hypothetical protein EBZ49_02595 [Proteobacteria bacterium]|nr:hypothetical protein [Pseudomonadota bacterium]